MKNVSEKLDSLINALVLQIKMTLSEMLGGRHNVSLGDISISEKFDFEGFIVRVEIKGGVKGYILMQHAEKESSELFSAIYKEYFGGDVDGDAPSYDIVVEILYEWINLIIGRSTRELSVKNIDIKFDAPIYCVDSADVEKVIKDYPVVVNVPVGLDDEHTYNVRLIVKDNGSSSNSSPLIEKDSPILIVDDSSLQRMQVMDFLKHKGFTNVHEAGNGDECLEKFNEINPVFILLDIVMPGMNGDEVLEKIREMDKEVVVVMQTSIADDKVVRQCYELGATGYVLKPMSARNMHEKLSSYLPL